MKDIEKRVMRLEQRRAMRSAPPMTLLEIRHGEDARLVADTDGPMIVHSIVGYIPRPEYATRESVLAALPGAKRWLTYKYSRDPDEAEKRQAEEREWRALCELAAIDYDAVEFEALAYAPSRHD